MLKYAIGRILEKDIEKIADISCDYRRIVCWIKPTKVNLLDRIIHGVTILSTESWKRKLEKKISDILCVYREWTFGVKLKQVNFLTQ